MFNNISQGFLTTGAAGYLVIIPVLRFLAALFMAFSTYKLLRARQDKHKFIWILAIVFSPILARCAYEVYCKLIVKKDTKAVKGSTSFFIISIAAFVLSAILTVISVVFIGVGYIKSEINGEPLATFFDAHGNEYDDFYEVPLYDQEGNTYLYESAWFTAGNYIDQNGKTYDGDYCYLSEDGYFYFDADDQLKPYKDFDYYTDGETIFYYLFNRVYWEEDGTIYEVSGRFHLKLFDLNK